MGLETAAIVAAGASAASAASGAASSMMAANAQKGAANTADARLAQQQFRNQGLQDRAIEYQTPELQRFRRMLDIMENNASDSVRRNESSGYGNVMRLLNPGLGGATSLDGVPTGRGATVAALGAQRVQQTQELALPAQLAQRQAAILGQEATGYGRLAAGLVEDRASLDAYKGAAEAEGTSGLINSLGSLPMNAMMAYYGFGGGGAGATPLPAGGAPVAGQLIAQPNPAGLKIL